VPNDNLNIETLIDFSKQQDDLIKGHQLEMQQVLADKQHQRTIICFQNNVIAQLKNK